MKRFLLFSLATLALSASAHAATFKVTSVADSGPGTLRQAILDANAAPGADAINFNLPKGTTAIDLTTSGDNRPNSIGGQNLSAFLLADDVTITGPGANLLAIRRSSATGTPLFRLFRIERGITATLSGLTLSNGRCPNNDAVEGSYSYRSGYRGGGFWNEGNLTLQNCAVNDNATSLGFYRTIEVGGRGGAIFNSSESALTLTNCSFRGNASQLQGGAVYSLGSLQMSNCTLWENKSLSGGGVYNEGTATIVSCTIAANKAITDFIDRVPTGGGIGTISALTLSNSIVASNSAGNGAQADADADIFASDTGAFQGNNNLIGTVTSTKLSGQQNLIGLNPRLGLLQNNGGSVPTAALLAGSPAIDAGQTSLTTDQRGVARPFGVAADIGAFEFNQVLPFSFPELELTPIVPHIGDTLFADAAAYDPQHRPITYSYEWTRLRGGASQVLPSKGRTLKALEPNVLPGDRIKVTVTASNGVDTPISRSLIAAIFNSPIRIDTLTLQPKTPYTFEKMIATVKTSDEDKTRPYFTYVWTKNGVPMRTVTNTRNNQDFYELNKPGNGDKGDVIQLTVTASDGASSDTSKAQATVRNSVPVLASLALTPQAPRVGQVIASAYAGRDADGDTLSRIYKWKIGNKVLAGETGSRLDLAKYPAVKAGDVISLEMRLSDVTSLSKTLSASVTVVPDTTSGATKTATPSANAL